jgi:uncharacterized protein (DUF885 family)
MQILERLREPLEGPASQGEKMSPFRITLAIALAGAIAAPSYPQATAPPTLPLGTHSANSGGSAAAARKLRDFLAADWKYWMTEEPEEATTFGYPGQNARWTDWSPAAIDRRAQHLKKSIADMKGMSRGEFPASEQLNYDLYLELLERAEEGQRFHIDSLPMASVVPLNLYAPVTQTDGLLQNAPDTIDQMPTEHASDYEDILSRLNAYPALVDQTIALMKVGMAHGWTPPKVTMQGVPKQATDEIFSDPMASPLLGAFKKFPASFTDAQKTDFTARAKAAYSDKVSPTLARLRDFLEQTYVPACRDSISAAALPDGADYYRYMVRWQTTTKLTPEQIHQTGLDQVKELRAQIEQVVAQTGYAGRVTDFENFLRTDPQFFAKTPAELLKVYRDAAKRADPETAHLIGKLPRLPYGIRPIPDATAPGQTDGYYEQGSPPTGRPGYVYVNTYKLDSRPEWEVEDTILHEGVPGHHLQVSLGQEMENVPEFRKQLGYSAYVEGWALYSESLGTEMGFYTDPYQKFGYLSGQMWRAVRLVVDTGMHSMGWTREQAIQYFEENTGLPGLLATSETDRYIVWPGQALAYKTGQLKIRELRTRAEKELGDRFDIRAFHDVILDNGALPLDLLETRVNAWIAREKSAGKTPQKSQAAAR